MAAIAAGEEKKTSQALEGGVYPGNPTTVRGAASQFDCSPDGANLIYVQGKNVVVRSTNPSDPSAYVYQEHKKECTVARFSPNGNFVASGDESGTIRVWKWNAKHDLVKEIKALGAAVCDLRWGPESKRIVIVGDGSKKARAILASSGSDQGPNMSGHMKKVLTCDYRPVKPYRAVTAGEDMQFIYHEGPPFRRKFSNKTAHRGAFINCVRFSPDGTKFATVGSDKKVYIFNADDGAKLQQLKGHTGTVYSCCWTPDGASLLTSSSDKTVRLWDVESATCTTVFQISPNPAVGDMQVACLVTPQGSMFSMSLNGNINCLSPEAPDAPAAVINGHADHLKAFAVDVGASKFVTSDTGGTVCIWSINGPAIRASGAVHGKSVRAVAVGGGRFYSAGNDNVVRSGSLETGVYDAEAPLGGAPRENGLQCASQNTGIVVAVSHQTVQLLRDGAVAASYATGAWTSTCCAVTPDGTAAVVGADNGKTYRLAIDGDSLGEPEELFATTGNATVLVFTADGQRLGVGTSQREVLVWDYAAGSFVVSGGRWKTHSSAISSLSWHPDGVHITSGSVDQGVCTWSTENMSKKNFQSLVHKYGPVVGLGWVDDSTLLSAGDDTVIKTHVGVELP